MKETPSHVFRPCPSLLIAEKPWLAILRPPIESQTGCLDFRPSPFDVEQYHMLLDAEEHPHVWALSTPGDDREESRPSEWSTSSRFSGPLT